MRSHRMVKACWAAGGLHSHPKLAWRFLGLPASGVDCGVFYEWGLGFGGFIWVTGFGVDFSFCGGVIQLALMTGELTFF